MSAFAWDYYDDLDARVKESLKNGIPLDSQEELFFAFVMSLANYESKYKELCQKN